MPLSKEKILELINQPKRASGSRGTKCPDTSVRDYQTWFALVHKMYDENNHKSMRCENPNCVDPRSLETEYATQFCASIEETYICRYCFLDGYGLNPNQSQLVV